MTLAPTFAVSCPRCRVALPWESYNTPGFVPCPSCGAEIYAAVFRAASEGAKKGATGDALLDDADASCFHHPSKKAVVVCEMCGRFLCSLCSIKLGGQDLCAACISAAKKKGKLGKLENRRTLYDEAALALALFPCVLIWPTVITAPLVIVIAVRHWNTPLSILPRRRIRFILAALIAACQIVVWVVGLGVFFWKRFG
ncbi:B-box zinc finger protein [Verrucomicrobiota bacterium]